MPVFHFLYVVKIIEDEIYSFKIYSITQKIYLVLKPDHRAKGVLQLRPPIKPSIENCQKGSDPAEPKTAPKVGSNKVMYVIGNRITSFILLIMENIIETKIGTLNVIPNSHKSNLESVVRSLLANIKMELVVLPARLPIANILNPINQFIFK